jgi:hypothetical protein
MLTMIRVIAAAVATMTNMLTTSRKIDLARIPKLLLRTASKHPMVGAGRDQALALPVVGLSRDRTS